MSSGLDKAIKDFIQIIRESGNKGTSPLDAQAEVLRIDEDGTAWVHLPGGVDETPVKLTINAEVGDKVHVRLSGGRAWITGNQTAPPTDDKTAITAKSLANTAGNRAKTAQKTANQAQIVADSAQTSAEQARDDAANAQTGVDSLNDTVFGVQTFEYVLDGVAIPAHKREDGTYYYILNDEEVTVAESDLVHDADGDLVSYQEGGINESLNDISNNIDAINTEVDGLNAREDALYESIQDNSLIARKNARVTGNSVIITNDTTTEDISNLLNYLQLNADSIMIYGDGDSIVTIAKTEGNAGYMEMAGTSLLIAQESRLSTIRLRSADRIGSLALVAGSNGHVSLREVLD